MKNYVKTYSQFVNEANSTLNIFEDGKVYTIKILKNIKCEMLGYDNPKKTENWDGLDAYSELEACDDEVKIFIISSDKKNIVFNFTENNNNDIIWCMSTSAYKKLEIRNY